MEITKIPAMDALQARTLPMSVTVIEDRVYGATTISLIADDVVTIGGIALGDLNWSQN